MTVSLISHDASDLKCVNAARVSYNTHHDELTEGDEKLIAAMIREGHGSVFEHSTFTFHVEAPIAVVREWQRHRIGHSYNEMSGRYVEMPAAFEFPQPRKQEGKAMQYEFSPIENKDNAFKAIMETYSECYETYQKLLGLGIAKEVARYVLPLGLMTQFYWTCNARSLMHFLSLRAAPQAMKEIRDRALEAEKYFADVMPITHEHFLREGRKAP